jgi:hypothetical protein
MDQPTAGAMLAALDRFVGEWTMQAGPPGGPPWPGRARVRFDWLDSGALPLGSLNAASPAPAPRPATPAALTFLVQRWRVESPDAPDGSAIIGCDAANGTYYELYADERGVCRVYEMSLHDREWTLRREGKPFAQRFTGTFSEDGNTITGRWELADDGETWRTDFDVTFTRVA